MDDAVGPPDGPTEPRQPPAGADEGPQNRRGPHPRLGPFSAVSPRTQQRRARRRARAAVRLGLGYDVWGDHRRPPPAPRIPAYQLPPDRPDRKGAADRRRSRPGGGTQDLRVGPVERRRGGAD